MTSEDQHRHFNGRMLAQAAFFRASGCPAAIMMQRGEYCFAFGRHILQPCWFHRETNDNEKRA